MTTNSEEARNEILRKPYVRRLRPDESGGYTGSIQEFPGLVAEGDTAEEVLQNLDTAAASWIEASLSQGREIVDPIDFEGCSGKIALRIPRSLHKQAAELAELEGCSLNQLLTSAIAQHVGQKHVLREVASLIEKNLHQVLRSVTITSPLHMHILFSNHYNTITATAESLPRAELGGNRNLIWPGWKEHINLGITHG